MTVIPQKDCYNVTIYILYIYLSLSLRVLKRLVLLLLGYLQKNNVTEFCNKWGVFCYIVTSCKVLSLKVLSPKVIVAEPAPCHAVESFKLKSFWSPRCPRSLTYARTHARSPARSDYYDVFQTDNTNTDTKVETKKSPPKWASYKLITSSLFCAVWVGGK